MIEKIKKEILRNLNKNLNSGDTDFYINYLNNKKKVQKMSLFELFVKYSRLKKRAA